MIGEFLLFIAGLLLFHAAYTTHDHVSHIKAFGQLEASIPRNIMWECVGALILGILGACLYAPPLRDITWESEMKKRTIDEMDARPGFASYVSRARLFQTERTSHRNM